MSDTTNRVVVKSVIIARDGNRLSPPIGKAFAFTADEVEAINKANPRALRPTKDEDTEATLAEVKAMSASPARAAVLRLQKTGAGKTSAMADGMDGAGVTGQSGAGGAGTGPSVLTIQQITDGLADLDDDALTAALNAEREGAKRAGAIKVYEAEIAKRKTADDDL